MRGSVPTVFKPHGAMTLAEYIGGLSLHTNIPKASLATLANVSERTILNWKNDFAAERERQQRAAPVVEALAKIIDTALENFMVGPRHLKYGFNVAGFGSRTSRVFSCSQMG